MVKKKKEEFIITPSLLKIIKECEDNGISQLMVKNMIKKHLDEMRVDSEISEEKEKLAQRKKYNVLINELLYDGYFHLIPSFHLLKLIKVYKNKYGYKFLYFLLTEVKNDLIFNGYHDKTNEEKSNILMYKIAHTVNESWNKYNKSQKIEEIF